jgi:hypothetical protein
MNKSFITQTLYLLYCEERNHASFIPWNGQHENSISIKEPAYSKYNLNDSTVTI